MGDADILRKTPLFEAHQALGARLVPFAGFEMPIQYSGIIEEHMAVRRAAGLFDVSHMGEFRVQGENARRFLQTIATNDIERLYDGRAMYTVMCYPDGGIVDDLLVYRLSENDFLLVVNASNVEKDYEWIRRHLTAGVDLEDVSEQTALIAIQGPRAFEIVEKAFDEPLNDLKYYHFKQSERLPGVGSVLLSHTGYTGEAGLEIYCDADKATGIWKALLDAGKPYGLLPAGLGARDTLRLEAGYPLYGNDLTSDINPLEANLGWITRLDKGHFIGRDALVKLKAEGSPRRMVGLLVEPRAIPRAGYPLVNDRNEVIGVVSSGGMSPVLQQGIGLGYVVNKPEYTEEGAEIGVTIRNRVALATVKRPPFHKK